jgi:hypothetical protein
VALLDGRLILPVETIAGEVCRGQPLATTALALHKYDFYSLSVGKLTNNGLIGQLVSTEAEVHTIRWSNCFAFPRPALIGGR